MRTTLNKIRSHNPCQDGWRKLLQHLGKTTADDEPVPLLTILESNGLDDALWCLRAVDSYEREIRLFAVWSARQVQHLMTDPRSIDALDVAEQFARGDATQTELDAAWDAAWAAAGDASWTAASDAAWGAACDASWTAASDAAWGASQIASQTAQEAKLREILSKPNSKRAAPMNIVNNRTHRIELEE